MSDPVGKCKTCNINLWGASAEPVIMPCGVANCPFETPEEQAAINYLAERSFTGSGLAQALEELG